MQKSFVNRLIYLRVVLIFVFLIFVGKLFQLQIIQYETYKTEAQAQQYKRSILPARRGKIFVRSNRYSDSTVVLATNRTLKTVYVDPVLLNYPSYNPGVAFEDQEKGDPISMAKLLAPILIHAHCEKVDGCIIDTDIENLSDIEQKSIEAYEAELIKIFTATQVERIVLEKDIAPSRILEIKELFLPGITIEGASIIANPVLIRDIDRAVKELSRLLSIKPEKLRSVLRPKLRRYVIVARRVIPEVSEKIQSFKEDPRYTKLLRGVRVFNEYRRYYPEKQLAAQVIGYVDSSGNGQYGVESKMNTDLQGKEGYITGATTQSGYTIFQNSSGLQNAEDGVDIVLSIDRIVQRKMEEILSHDQALFNADSGQILVLEPFSGKIIAMAHSPTFNPNKFGEIFRRYEISPLELENDKNNEDFNQRIPTIFDKDRYYRYFNLWGPEVFQNKIVSGLYEPGSVLKAITMAAAINAGEITPNTIYDDIGPVKVDEFEIRNASNHYGGETDMWEVLNESLNTGIAFITQKMGNRLLYNYLTAFGFGQLTDIEITGEQSGNLENWGYWSPSELVTRGFGQGISTTILQVGLSFGALANGGYLMQPILVEEIRHPDGRVTSIESKKIRRVITEDSSNTIKEMLYRSVRNGIARGVRIPGYEFLGKTGTSQTYKNGQVLEGLGTTITSFGGFAPKDKPRFVVIVKYDHPKTSQWGAETAARTFKKASKFLYDYYEIPKK